MCPAFLDGVMLNLINFICITVIAVVGLNILTGFCGQISIGQSAFMSVGAYTVAVLGKYFEINFIFALILAGLNTGLIGLIFGLPSVKIKGFYLAMATLAAQFLIPAMIAHPLEPLTEGTDSLRVAAPHIWGIVFDTPQSFFYLSVSLCILLVYFSQNLARTGVGRAFVAIRDDDLAAEVMGINIFRYKLLAFFICSIYAGIAGGLFAYYMRSVNTDNFSLTQSIWYLGMLIAGGMGSVTGSIFGVTFLLALEHILISIAMWVSNAFPAFSTSTGIQQALTPTVYGLVIVMFLIFEPRGLAHKWEVIKASWRLRPFSY